MLHPLVNFVAGIVFCFMVQVKAAAEPLIEIGKDNTVVLGTGNWNREKWTFIANADELLKTPKWEHDSKEEFPLSIREAVQSAVSAVKQNFKELEIYSVPEVTAGSIALLDSNRVAHPGIRIFFVSVAIGSNDPHLSGLRPAFPVTIKVPVLLNGKAARIQMIDGK